jgi:hypothetical protein
VRKKKEEEEKELIKRIKLIRRYDHVREVSLRPGRHSPR